MNNKKKKIKIQNIAVLFENIEYGGATTHLINLINSNNYKFVKFCIITNKDNKAINNILSSCSKNSYKIIYYNSLFIPFTDLKILKLVHFFLKPFLFIFSIFQMIKIIKEIKFDILLANFGGYGDFRTEISGIIAAKILQNKNLFLLIHHCYTKPFIWNNLVNKFLSSLIGRYVKGIIFVSNATKKNILKNTSLTKFFKGKLAVIHNGVDIKNKKFKKIKIFNKYKSKLKVLMLSRIESYKGHEDLIEAFGELPEKIKDKYIIFFVGTGKSSHIKILKKKIILSNLQKNFKFFNFLNFNSIDILKSVDIFFSLTRDFEGFGYSIAESLIAKTPVVSTKVGGTIEFLNKHNSELINPRDVKKISKILEKFSENRLNFKKKTIKGKILIEKKFNSELMASKFYNFFYKTI